jgi:hypothetical protein
MNMRRHSIEFECGFDVDVIIVCAELKLIGPILTLHSMQMSARTRADRGVESATFSMASEWWHAFRPIFSSVRLIAILVSVVQSGDALRNSRILAYRSTAIYCIIALKPA